MIDFGRLRRGMAYSGQSPNRLARYELSGLPRPDGQYALEHVLTLQCLGRLTDGMVSFSVHGEGFRISRSCEANDAHDKTFVIRAHTLYPVHQMDIIRRVPQVSVKWGDSSELIVMSESST